MTKRVTLKNIADALNISTMTVSRAINKHPYVDEQMRDIILKKAKEMGYFPNHIAKSLVERKTRIIGVVVPEITHSFFPDVIRGVEEIVYNAGYQIMLTHSAESSKRECASIETLASKRVDGLLVSIAESDTDFSIYRQILNSGLPIVFFDRCVFELGASCVSVNDEASASLITEHLIEHNYKKIAHLSGPLSVSISRARLSGYKKALKKNRIKLNKNWVVEAGFHETGGYKAMLQLLENLNSELPRAVFAVNDPAAFGAMKAVIEKNLRIPEDMAVVGFSDDIRAELMSPPLTTIRQPAYEVGKYAAEKLIAHIENKEESAKNIILKTELIIRESCGCKLKTI